MSVSNPVSNSAEAPPIAPAEPEGVHASVGQSDLIRIAFIGLATGIIGSGIWSAFGHPHILGAVAVAVGGYPILREALRDILHRRMTMELSMTIALVAALAIRETFTALVITGFVLVAEVLEDLTVSRGRRAISRLLDFLPRHASLRSGDTLVDTPVDELRPGDRILVVPGSRIPVDGTVMDGESSVDQAALTGESRHVDVRPGDHVLAGSINLSGAIDVEAERVGADTTFGHIVEAVEHASEKRAPIQKIADRLAGYLVYCAIAAAGVTFAMTRDPRATISVIIVAGACGVAAGTPLAILGAIGRAARFGADHQGRYLPGSAVVGGYGRAGQDGYADVR